MKGNDLRHRLEVSLTDQLVNEELWSGLDITFANEDNAVAHNFITRDGYTDILQIPTVVVIQGPLYNDEVTTLPSVLTVGVGPVTIFSGGKYIEGTWRRNDIADPFEFTDSKQQQIEIPPSKQWIHILPLNGEIVISDN